MAELKRIEIDKIKLGSCYSKPVYFEDGTNMFLSDNKRATQYHLDVLKSWNVPYLLTEGEEIACPVEKSEAEVCDLEELEDADDVEDLEEL